MALESILPFSWVPLVIPLPCPGRSNKSFPLTPLLLSCIMAMFPERVLPFSRGKKGQDGNRGWRTSG